MAGKKLIVVLLLAGLGVLYLPSVIKLLQLQARNRQLEHQIAALKTANQALWTEQQRLLNDPFYLEKVAREKMGVTRKGEILYKVVPESSPPGYPKDPGNQEVSQ